MKSAGQSYFILSFTLAVVKYLSAQAQGQFFGEEVSSFVSSSCFNRNTSLNQRYLVYPNKSLQAVRIPYAQWTSAKVLANVVQILLSEKMEYDTFFVDIGYDDYVAVSNVAGCRDPTDDLCVSSDELDPKIHFTLESWNDGIMLAQSLPRRNRPTLLSALDYNLDDGYFMWAKVKSDALHSQHPLVLDHFSSYNADFFEPHLHFDNWSTVLDLLPPDVAIPCADVFSGVYRYGASSEALAHYTRLTNDSDFSCREEAVWIAPACRNDTSRCVPLVVLSDIDRAMQRAALLNMPLAIIVADADIYADNATYFTAVKRGRFLFHYYQPNDVLFDSSGAPPIPLALPRRDNIAQARGDYRSGVEGLKGRNYGWRRLAEVDRFVTFLASAVSLYDTDVGALMARSAALQAAGATPDDSARRVACEWLRAAPDRWAGWIPAICPPGEHSDAALTTCLACPAGAFCAGWTAVPQACPANSYCPAGASAPRPCPEDWGTGVRAAASAAECVVCRDPSSVQMLGRCVPTSTVLLAAILPALALLVAAVAARACRGDAGDVALWRTLAALRVRLRMELHDGFVLSSERPPVLFRRESVIFVQLAHAMAAARFEQRRGDFDPKHLDGFCHAAHDHDRRRRLRAWVLEVSAALLDPDDDCDAADADDFAARPGSSAEMVVGCGPEQAQQESRYARFTGRVCKLQIWREDGGALFYELQEIVQRFMDNLAQRCDTRYRELLMEPGGSELERLACRVGPLWRALDASAGGGCCHATAEAEAAAWSDADAELACRQDHPKVMAVRAGPKERELAALEMSLPPRLGSAHGAVAAIAVDCFTEPINRSSIVAAVAGVRNEEVFVAQLHHAAVLVNQGFQASVLAAVARHIASESGSEGGDGGKAKGTSFADREWVTQWTTSGRLVHQSRGSLLASRSRMILDMTGMQEDQGAVAIACRFADGSVGEVAVHAAPPKTAARMLTKLLEYAHPHPKSSWPLAANILDPVRASIICQNCNELLQVISWFTEHEAETGLFVCRAKNGFASGAGECSDGYRDVKLSVVYKELETIRIIGEIQVHDYLLYKLKLKMHKLYKIKRASSLDAL